MDFLTLPQTLSEFSELVNKFPGFHFNSNGFDPISFHFTVFFSISIRIDCIIFLSMACQALSIIPPDLIPFDLISLDFNQIPRR